jgi:hypothetical protein
MAESQIVKNPRGSLRARRYGTAPTVMHRGDRLSSGGDSHPTSVLVSALSVASGQRSALDQQSGPALPSRSVGCRVRRQRFTRHAAATMAHSDRRNAMTDRAELKPELMPEETGNHER